MKEMYCNSGNHFWLSLKEEPNHESQGPRITGTGTFIQTVILKLRQSDIILKIVNRIISPHRSTQNGNTVTVAALADPVVYPSPLVTLLKNNTKI